MRYRPSKTSPTRGSLESGDTCPPGRSIPPHQKYALQTSIAEKAALRPGMSRSAHRRRTSPCVRPHRDHFPGCGDRIGALGSLRVPSRSDTVVRTAMKTFVNHDVAELVFRLLFSSIFVVLGTEHLFNDGLHSAIDARVATDEARLFGGKRRHSLGGRSEHCVGCTRAGRRDPSRTVPHRRHARDPRSWDVSGARLHRPRRTCGLWDLYQRSNFIKNVCLLGVCFHLLTHEPGSLTLPRVPAATAAATVTGFVSVFGERRF